VESEFKLEITCSDTMINYQFSQKLKLLGNDEVNHLTIILTHTSCRKQKTLAITKFLGRESFTFTIFAKISK
jgi:hypothetical protein